MEWLLNRACIDRVSKQHRVLTKKRMAANGVRCIPHVQRSCAGVFKPPLSQQRYQHVTDVLHGAGARDILDLGCGDGKLLEFLLSAATGAGVAVKGSVAGWQRLTGLDVSESAIARGCRRLQVLGSFLHAARKYSNAVSIVSL